MNIQFIIFLIIFYFSLNYEETFIGEISYLETKIIRKRFATNEILILYFNIKEYFELENSFVKFIFHDITNLEFKLNIYVCFDQNPSDLRNDCNITYNHLTDQILIKEDLIFEYQIPNIKGLEHIFFELSNFSKSGTLYSGQVYPLKIFDIKKSETLDIMDFYSKNIIPKNSFFFLRIQENIFKNASLNFTVKNLTEFQVNFTEYSSYPDNKGIQNCTFFPNQIFLNKYYEKEKYNEIYFDFNYYFTKSSNNYVVLYVKLYDSFDYFLVSLSLDNPEESQDSQTSDESEKSSKDSDDSSTSPALIAFIVIICILFVAFIVYFILRKLGYFRRCSLTSEKIEFNKNPSNNNEITIGDRSNDSTPAPILGRTFQKQKD